MRGLLLKEFYYMNRYLKTLVVIIGLFFIGITYHVGNALFMLGALPVLFSIVTTFSFKYDEKGNFDRYAMCLPVTRRDIVLSRYIVDLLMVAAGTGFSVFLTALYLYRSAQQLSVEIVSTLIFSFLLGCLIFCVYNPLAFRYGYQKSRSILVTIVIVLFLLCVPLFLLNVSLPLPGVQLILIMGIMSPFIVLFLFMASLMFAYIGYSRLEF